MHGAGEAIRPSCLLGSCPSTAWHSCDAPFLSIARGLCTLLIWEKVGCKLRTLIQYCLVPFSETIGAPKEYQA